MNLFNPWVLLAIVVSIVTSFGTGYFKGKHDENIKQQVEIARLNELARTKEAALVAAVNTTANELRKADAQAKVIAGQRDAAIDAGTYKLRVPVKTTCPVQAAPDTPVAAGDNAGEARAELDPETGKTLFAIAEEGDRAIRKLNACIILYNEAIESQKEIK